MSEARKFSTKVPRQLACASAVRQLVDRIGEEAGLSDPKTFDLKVATCEAYANAVEHTDGDSEITVDGSIDGGLVQVVVKGEGDFLPISSSPNYVGEHRGLGLPLIVSLMDEVIISKLHGVTEVRLRVRRG